MKKKVISIIAICLVLVLSVPVTSYAYSSSDIKVHSRSSVSGVFDDFHLNNAIQNIYSFSGNAYGFNVNSIYDKIDLLPSGALSYDNYILYIRNSNLYLFCFNGSSFICVTNSFDDQVYYADVSCNWYTYLPTVNGGYSYTIYEMSPSGSSWTGSGNNSAYSDPYYSFYGGGLLLSSNMPLYYFNELVFASIPHQDVTSSNLYSHSEIYDQMTNLNDVNLPYVDGDGNIVDPTPVVEGNNNHMFFQSCDLGFCEPYGIENLQTFGGAYLYCRYSVDNWVVNHINEYKLQFNVISAIGAQQNNFSYQVALDRNGLVTIPFTDLFTSNSSSAIPVNNGFTVCVTDKALNNDYYITHLYSLASTNAAQFVEELDSDVNYNLQGLGWSALKGEAIPYLLAWVHTGGTSNLNNISIIPSLAMQAYNPYILRVNVKLVSGEDSSGDYAEKFDLYTGDQTTVDTSGLVNPDPFEPVPDSSDPDYMPSVPQDPNSTTPSTIIYTGGTWQGSLQGVIGFDPGYRELSNDVNADPNGNFTQYLDPMKNDSFGGWLMSFMNDLPTPMKSILISGCAVGVFFGIYRFIRRG